MNKYFLNRNDILVNTVKKQIVLTLFVLEIFSLFVFFCLIFNINMLYSLFGCVLGLLIINSKVYKSSILKVIITIFNSKNNPHDELLSSLEKISLDMDIQTPRVITSNSNSFFVYSFGFKRNDSFIILSKGLLENLDQSQLRYIISQQLHLISNKDTTLISHLIFFFALPMLILEIAIHYLYEKKYTFIAVTLRLIVLILTYIPTSLFYLLLLSKNRIYNADLAACKILKSTEGFCSTLEMFAKSPQNSSRYYPLCFKPSSFFQSPNMVFDKLISIQPDIKSRITYIRSLIG